MGASSRIPLVDAVVALEVAADQLGRRHEVAVAALRDLARNVEAGVAELWRSDTGAVFIRTAAVEVVGGPGDVIATSHVLDD